MGFFNRVIVIHVLEHLPDLPAMITGTSGIEPERHFFRRISLLSCLMYEIATKISAERIFKVRYKLPYRWFSRREHINFPAEIIHVIREKFDVFDLRFFPFRVPVVNVNLCIGLTARKR